MMQDYYITLAMELARRCSVETVRAAEAATVRRLRGDK